MPRKLRVLSASDVTAELGMGEALELVEQAFGERGRGRVQMPPKSYLFFGEYEGDLRVMPAFLEGLGQAGVKSWSMCIHETRRSMASQRFWRR